MTAETTSHDDDVAAAREYVAVRMAEILSGSDEVAQARALGLVLGYCGDKPEVIAAVVAAVDEHFTKAGR